MSENQNDGQSAEKKRKKTENVEKIDKTDTGKRPPTVTTLPDPFTCYISACPEPRNADFKEPEFLVCYKCPSSSDDPEGKIRYFCYPIMANSQKGPNVIQRYTPKTPPSTSEGDEQEEVPPYIQFPQWYPMNQGFYNYCQSAYHQCPQYMHQQQQQQQQFYQCAPPYGYQNFDGNFYFT